MNITSMNTLHHNITFNLNEIIANVSIMMINRESYQYMSRNIEYMCKYIPLPMNKVAVTVGSETFRKSSIEKGKLCNFQIIDGGIYLTPGEQYELALKYINTTFMVLITSDSHNC